MKVALVHDSLSEFGGAERVLAELLNLFPKAKVFTSYYKKDIVQTHFPTLNTNNLIVSWYQHFPRKTTTTIQFWAPFVWRFKNLENFDLVITSSCYYLSPITSLSCSRAIHYIHSLPKNLFGLEEPSFWQKRLPFSYQKKLYIQSLKNSDHIIANSQNIQRQLKKIIRVNSTVIYPPVLVLYSLPKRESGEYYLIISRVDKTKNLEIAISACRYLKLPLKIAGFSSNPEYLKELQKLGGKTVEFLGFVSEEKRKELYKKAIAFLFCSKNEDFGITPIEAMTYGVPVIAFWGGGTKETIIEGKTGLFFRHHSWQSMAEAIKKFKKMKFEGKNLYQQAKKFSREKFRQKIISYLKTRRVFENIY